MSGGVSDAVHIKAEAGAADPHRENTPGSHDNDHHSPMPPDPTHNDRSHKRRQKARQKQRKQGTLDDLLVRIPWEQVLPGLALSSPLQEVEKIEEALSGAFQAIPRWGECPGASDFWAKIPSVCTPQGAVLNEAMSSTRLLEGDLKRQHKYQRKLQHQLQRGDITPAQYQSRLAQKSRRVPTPAPSSSDQSPPRKEENSTPAFRLMGTNRGQRKQWQVECFAALLRCYTPTSSSPCASEEDASRPISSPMSLEWPSAEALGAWMGKGGALEGVRRVVDFGCGSGNLCLALAAYWPDTEFVFVDRNEQSLQILRQRAEAAQLRNVVTLSHELQEGPALYDTPLPPFEVGIGLHCCGALTDMVMALCRHHRAACLVCPCCNGKIKNRPCASSCPSPAPSSLEGSGALPLFTYPRSRFLQGYVSEEEYVQRLSPAADDLKNYAAKCLVEWDRALWACEQGYSHVYALKLTPLAASPKHHVLYCCP